MDIHVTLVVHNAIDSLLCSELRLARKVLQVPTLQIVRHTCIERPAPICRNVNEVLLHRPPGASLTLGVTSFVRPRRQFHLFIHERLLVQSRLVAHSGELPRSNVQEFVIITQCLALGSLILDAEVSAG